MAQSRLDILIAAKNNASSQIKQIQNDLKGLDQAADSVAGGLSGIGKALGVGGFVALGAGIAATTVELARAGAETARLADSFDTLAAQAGQTGQAMLQAMRQASRGTISDSELMLAANRAMLLGVADSADEMAQLLEVAAARGKAMGLTTAQAFSDLVTGIGRMSPPILDNLGIVTGGEKVFEDYAAAIGKSADALSDVERKQALVNAVIASSRDLVTANGESAEDVATQFERAAASFANARARLGEMVSPGIAVTVERLAEVTNQLVDAIERAQQATGVAGQRYGDLEAQWAGLTEETRNITAEQASLQRQINRTAQQVEYFRNVVANSNGTNEEAKRILNALQAELDRLTAEASHAAAGVSEADIAAQRFAPTLVHVAEAASQAGSELRKMDIEAIAAMDAFNLAMTQNQGIMRQIEQAAAGSGALFAQKQGPEAGIARQQAITDELKAQEQIWRDLGYTAEQINEVLMPGYIAQLRESERELFKTERAAAKLPEWVEEAERAFEDLKGKVRGVLDAALDPGVGVDPDKILEEMFGFREDAINENARRLADIAKNGLKDQDWLGAFREAVPDVWKALMRAGNPQEEAAFILREFQDGLRPELIDKERAKQLVRRMLVGEENMAQLAQEIAQELAAEMGIPIKKALAAAEGALGVGDAGSTAGGDAGQSFASGAQAALQEANGGANLVDTFVSQIRAVYGRIQQAGRDAGAQWGSGFLETVGDSVPPALVQLLTDLVTPGVLAELNTQATLTGAP